MTSVDELWDFIGYVLVYAPDEFPYEDFLPPDGQMTLERAFEQLRAGVLVAYPEEQFADKRNELHDLLDRSFSAWRNKQPLQGEALLNEFERGIFKL